jgi:WD40 repeat protein
LKKIRSFVLPEKTMGKPNFGRIGISDDGRRLTAIWYRGGRPGNYACITWRLPTGEQSRVMPVSVVDGSLYGGRFSKDNTILVGHDGRIVAVDTGRELIELEVNGWTVSTPSAISNDGNLIAFRLEEKTADKKTPPKKFAVQVWEMVTFQPVCRLPTDNMGHLAFVGNRCLVSIGLNSFRIWDLAHEKETWIRSVPSRSPYGNSFASAFAISRDGSKIVTGQTDSTLLRWDFPAPKREKRALTDAEFTQYWTDLGAVDARRAFQAIHHLNADPDKVVPVLRERINWTAPLYQMAPS